MLFILGCSRTASKAYMHLLNEHSHFNMTREMHLHKRSGQNTLYGKFKKYGRNPENLQALSVALARLSNASFWKSDDYSPEDFHAFLEKEKPQKLSYKSLISLLLEFDRAQNSKEVAGAKFPMNINYYPVFRRWFPSDQYIFLGRDPLTMAFSQFNKHKMKRTSRRLVMLLHVASMFNATILWGRIFKPVNSLFIHYEDFKNDKEAVVKRVCQFLQIDFDPAMTELPVLGSRIQKNADDYQLKKWEKSILKMMTFPFRSVYLKSQTKSY